MAEGGTVEPVNPETLPIVCPECGERAVTHFAGSLPVCTACDWTGWTADD